MLESHLNEGNQSSNLPISDLKYGVSITDACIDFSTTEKVLFDAVTKLHQVLKIRIKG